MPPPKNEDIGTTLKVDRCQCSEEVCTLIKSSQVNEWYNVKSDRAVVDTCTSEKHFLIVEEQRTALVFMFTTWLLTCCWWKIPRAIFSWMRLESGQYLSPRLLLLRHVDETV